MDKKLEEMLGALGSLEELVKMIAVEEEEVFVGPVSPAIMARFTQLNQDVEDAKTQLERETEDMHKIIERKQEELINHFQRRNDEIWADCYVELGIEKNDKKRYRIKKKKSIVVEVIEKTPEAEENVIDFRRKL